MEGEYSKLTCFEELNPPVQIVALQKMTCGHGARRTKGPRSEKTAEQVDMRHIELGQIRREPLSIGVQTFGAVVPIKAFGSR